MTGRELLSVGEGGGERIASVDEDEEKKQGV